jgi:hypothetical protein
LFWLLEKAKTETNCVFCSQNTLDSISFGNLLKYNTTYAHYNCLVCFSIVINFVIKLIINYLIIIYSCYRVVSHKMVETMRECLASYWMTSTKKSKEERNWSVVIVKGMGRRLAALISRAKSLFIFRVV